MKYFAKLLPTEGQIKELDIVFKDNEKGTVVHIYPDNQAFIVEVLDNTTATYPPSRVKLAKLFLCSRDIQVGDKVNSPIGTGEITLRRPSVRFPDREQVIVSVGSGLDDTEAYFVDENEVLKVVGEISPEATWVTEGAEFDNTQVGVLYNFIGEDSDDKLFTLEEWPKAVKRMYKDTRPDYIQRMLNCPEIAVKCPHCGTFS